MSLDCRRICRIGAAMSTDIYTAQASYVPMDLSSLSAVLLGYLDTARL